MKTNLVRIVPLAVVVAWMFPVSVAGARSSFALRVDLGGVLWSVSSSRCHTPVSTAVGVPVYAAPAVVYAPPPPVVHYRYVVAPPPVVYAAPVVAVPAPVVIYPRPVLYSVSPVLCAPVPAYCPPPPVSFRHSRGGPGVRHPGYRGRR